MSTTLTRDTLINYAGLRAGNTNIAAITMQDWLNNIIDQLSEAYKWPESMKVQTGTLPTATWTSIPTVFTTAPTVSLPADFGDLWDVHGLSTVDTSNNHQTLMPLSRDDYDLLTLPLVTGQPLRVVFDLNGMTFTVYPVPPIGSTFTYQLRYRIKFARLSGNVTIPFANDEIFIQALYIRILQYEDDSRYLGEIKVLDALINRYLGGFNKSPIKNKQVRFNADRFQQIQQFR